jgi:NitT/TauT family transport system substrate-binding protein
MPNRLLSAPRPAASRQAPRGGQENSGAALRFLETCLLLALALLAGTPAAATELVFAVGRSPGSLPIYVAQAEGYFADERLELRVVECAFGRLCLRQLLDGQAALATAADSPIVAASFGAPALAIVATISTNRNDSKIIVRRSGPVHTVGELAGRRIGTFIGTSAHYFLDSVSLLSGIDPQGLTVVDLPPGKMADRLKAGEVDAVALFEPYAQDVARALGADAQVLSNRRIYLQSWNLVATQAVTARHEGELQGLLRALLRSEALIQRNPARARDILRQRLQIDEAAVEAVWSDYSFKVALDQSLLNTLGAQARWALRKGVVQGAMPNYLQFIDERPLLRVRPSSVTLVR